LRLAQVSAGEPIPNLKAFDAVMAQYAIPNFNESLDTPGTDGRVGNLDISQEYRRIGAQLPGFYAPLLGKAG
jgi:hypothetical protein